MMHKLPFFVFLLFITFYVTSCASSQTVTTNTAPPPTQTPLPPTLTPIPPSEVPTLEPTPTRTPFPTGTLVGCVYHEGEKVTGYFNFRNEFGVVDSKTWQAPRGCVTMGLRAGTYEVTATSFIPECLDASPTTGCFSDRITVEILPGEKIEMDFEVAAPES